jgi:hypothetical protein
MVEAGIEQLNSVFVNNCCKIAIALIDLQKGEETAQACEMAWFQQLTLTSGLRSLGHIRNRQQSLLAIC